MPGNMLFVLPAFEEGKTGNLECRDPPQNEGDQCPLGDVFYLEDTWAVGKQYALKPL